MRIRFPKYGLVGSCLLGLCWPVMVLNLRAEDPPKALPVNESQENQPATVAPSSAAATPGGTATTGDSSIPTAATVVEGTGTSGDATTSESAQPIVLTIISPKHTELLNNSPVQVRFDLKNTELREGGNALRVIIDNQPPLTLTNINQPLPLPNLNDGGHMIRAYVVRANGTIIRDPQAYASAHFYIHKKDFQNFADPTKPYLTVNLPAGDGFDTNAHGQVCVDVQINNTLARSNYKVRYSMDSYRGYLSAKEPAYWDNVPYGRHTITLELFDINNRAVLGPFNRVERTFEVRQVLKAAPLTPEKEERGEAGPD